jgi:hypothetical protein
MTSTARARSILVWLGIAMLGGALAAGCGAGKHPKVVGPPPEYEPPEEADGAPMRALPRTPSSDRDGSVR